MHYTYWGNLQRRLRESEPRLSEREIRSSGAKAVAEECLGGTEKSGAGKQSRGRETKSEGK